MKRIHLTVLKAVRDGFVARSCKQDCSNLLTSTNISIIQSSAKSQISFHHANQIRYYSSNKDKDIANENRAKNDSQKENANETSVTNQKSQREIDVSEKLIYEPHKHLTREEQERLIKAQVEVYFEKWTWKDRVFSIFMILMSIVAAFYFFILKATQNFTEEYTKLVNRLFDERSEVAIDIADYTWNFLSGLFLQDRNEMQAVDHEYSTKKNKDNSEWPAFHLHFDGFEYDKDLLKHPELKNIFKSVFGTEELSDIRMINTNYTQDMNHILNFIPLVKDMNGKVIKPYMFYFKSEILVHFPVVNIKTNAISVVKVVLTTQYDLKRFGKKAARIDPMTAEEIEAKKIEDFQREYKTKHGILKYYIDSWTGQFQEQSAMAINNNEDNISENDSNNFAQDVPNSVLDTDNNQETIYTIESEDQRNFSSCIPYEGLTPDEELALRHRRLRDKKGLIRYYWGLLRNTLDLEEDFDIFKDDPSEDETKPVAPQKKKKRKREKVYYFDQIPLTVEKVMLCNPNSFITDHQGFFNRIMGHSVVGNPVSISWPFEAHSEVVILENARKTEIGHYPFMDEATTGDAKQNTITGHLFLDKISRQGLPPPNGLPTFL